MKYLNLLFSALLLLLIPFQGFSQVEEEVSKERSEASFYHQKKSHLLNLSASLITNPASFSFDQFTGGSGTGDPSPAINLSYEYGLTQNIGVGALVGYYRVDAQQELSAQDLLGSDLLNDPTCLVECLLPINIGGSCDCDSKTVEERINVVTLAAKFSFHFVKIPGVDTYTNITLGYAFNRRKTIGEEALDLLLDEVSPKTNVPTFVYAVNGGIRYYFTPQIAAFGEAGYSNVHLLNLGVTYRW